MISVTLRRMLSAHSTRTGGVNYIVTRKQHGRRRIMASESTSRTQCQSRSNTHQRQSESWKTDAGTLAFSYSGTFCIQATTCTINHVITRVLPNLWGRAGIQTMALHSSPNDPHMIFRPDLPHRLQQNKFLLSLAFFSWSERDEKNAARRV